MVMTATVNGMPLVYSGQEAGLDRSLKFFDRDTILWKEHRFYNIYQKLFELKHNNQALWNGAWGGEMVRIYNDKPQQIISFYRSKNANKVISISNFSNKDAAATLHTKHQAGTYTDLFSGKTQVLKGDDVLAMRPWSYQVLYQ